MRSVPRVIATGALFGSIAIYLATTGLLLSLHARWIVVDRFTLAHALMLALAFGAGHVASRDRSGSAAIACAALSGAVAAAVLAGFAASMQAADLRETFIALSKPLFDLLTFGGGPARGAV